MAPTNKRKTNSNPGAGVVLMLFLCVFSSTSFGSDSARSGVESFLRQFESSTNDVNKYTALFTENLVVMLPDTPVIRGRDSWVQRMATMWQSYSEDLTLNSEDIKISGGLAVIHGTYEEDLNPLADIIARRRIGNFMLVCDLQDDGSWKASAMMWTVLTQEKPH